MHYTNDKSLDELKRKRDVCNMIKKEELKIENKLYNNELEFLTSLIEGNDIL